MLKKKSTLHEKHKIGYKKAIELLKDCSTPFGFIAAKKKTKNGNYTRIWARDSMICSIAALKTSNKFLHETAKKSLITLLKYQHKQGEIVSNVDPNTAAVSFGGTAGRIDSNLWFIIGFSSYVRKTKDVAFAKKYFSQVTKTIHILRIHEYNHKGLLYIPLAGDWADEYIQEGYVLYDEILYYLAYTEYAYLKKILKKTYKEDVHKAKRIKELIQQNFWVNTLKKNLYSPSLYKRALEKKKPYFAPYFNPGGYGNYFDLFAHSLAILTNITTKSQKSSITRFIKETFPENNIPAFYPVIKSSSKKFLILKQNFSVVFRNKPYEYHNGGVWPMVLGFYIASKPPHAKKNLTYLIDTVSENEWEFNENYNGKTNRAIGTPLQAWSAAGVILAYKGIYTKKEVFK